MKGKCKNCGYTAEVIDLELFGESVNWVFKKNKEWHCPECNHWHESGVPLVDDQSEGEDKPSPKTTPLDPIKEDRKDALVAKFAQCGHTEFYAEFVRQIYEASGLPEEVLMVPPMPRPEPAPPPRISLTRRTFYAVRSKRTGALLVEVDAEDNENCEFEYLWYTDDGYEHEDEDHLSGDIFNGIENTIDEARQLSEQARDESGNPEPVEIVRYRLTCEGPVQSENKPAATEEKKLLLTCDVVK